jgi:hypothetical protein
VGGGLWATGVGGGLWATGLGGGLWTTGLGGEGEGGEGAGTTARGGGEAERLLLRPPKLSPTNFRVEVSKVKVGQHS